MFACPLGETPDAGVAYPGVMSKPATWAVVGSAFAGDLLGTAVPPAIEAMASGVADALGGAG